jgi:GNAT superfamily N-acetyltransferase
MTDLNSIDGLMAHILVGEPASTSPEYALGRPQGRPGARVTTRSRGIEFHAAPGTRWSRASEIPFIRKTHASLEKLSFDPDRDEVHIAVAMSDRDTATLVAHPAVFRLPGGEAVTIRPIRPDDAGRLQDHFRGLSIESRRNRFLGAVNELSPREIARLANMDQPGELALVACADDDQGGALVAEAVHVIGPGSARCEFALSVTDPWQRRGLGTLLLRLIECRARLIGARHLFGDVLATNNAMKCLARQRGFWLRTPVTDARLIEIVKDLSLPLTGLPCDERFARLRPIAA